MYSAGPVSSAALVRASLAAVSLAERRYAKWSDGVTMRAAPESLVQTIVAERVARLGIKVLLEVSVKDLKDIQQGEALDETVSSTRSGRVDIAAYYKSTEVRFVVEIKKLFGNGSCLLEDCRRIHDLLTVCSSLQEGLMLGYTAAANVSTVMRRIDSAATITNSTIAKLAPLLPVRSPKGKARVLGAAVFEVTRRQRRP